LQHTTAKSGAKVLNLKFYPTIPPNTNFIRFLFLNLTHKNSFWLASVQNRNLKLRFPRLRQYPKRCDEIPSRFRHIARRLCRPNPFQGLRTSEGFAKCKTLRKASGRYA